MTAEEQKNVNDEGIAHKVPSDAEVSADKSREKDLKSDIEQPTLGSNQGLTEYDLFAGDEDFYSLLEESSNEKPVGESTSEGQLQQKFSRYRYQRFSNLQKILAFSIISVVSVLLYVLFKSPSGFVAGTTSITTQESLQPTQKGSVFEQTTQTNIQKLEPVLLPTQPLSLQVARNFVLQKEYDKAFATYDALRQALPAGEELLKDFLQLKMALCAKQVNDFEQASHLLAIACQSRSPAVRIVANYHLCLLEIQRKRFLRARNRAYNAIALIKAVDFDDDWALSFECDCSFLVAECLTRQILLLSSTDSDLSTDLWGKPTASSDPFANLSETELRRFLNSGSEHLNKGLLDPEIQKLEDQQGLSRWSVASYGAPIEELLAKFAVGANIDIHWTSQGNSGTDSTEGPIRQRPVSVYLPAATLQQIVLTASGCAGLLADLEEESEQRQVRIYDPTEYSSLNQHISFLSRQAVSLWQKFVLTYYSDRRLGNAHFLMGLLYSQTELPIEAIAEYRLVANRFSQMSLAPFALLLSSKLKASLRDYPGAREDLKQLIEQYPDVEIYGKAYLRLADATAEAGFHDEAARLYQRVYNFGLSAESKTASSFGAARSLYETKEYEQAVKWLIRYIDLAGNDESNNLYSAYFLLGRSNLALEKYQDACDAFEYALEEQTSREQYVEAIASLVKSHIEQENFVEALDTLESVRTVALSEQQSVEMLLLKCRILRMLGLLDSAIVTLRDRAEYISDSQLHAKISFELAKCYIAQGNLESARSGLTEILGIVQPGPLARQIAMELADVCLKLERGEQAASVCLRLMESDVPEQQKQKVLNMLATAYNLQKNYDKATLALSGQWK